MARIDSLDDPAALILDFDGPICDLFGAGVAAAIADELLALLSARGATVTAEHLRSPHDLLAYVAESQPNYLAEVEALLTRREIKTAETAEPAPGALSLFKRYPVAVVTNNTAEAVHTYLRRHRVSCPVFGRPPESPQLMKPHPHLLARATSHLGIEPAQAVFIGDSETDIVAGHRAGMPVIAYANKPGKRERFATLQPARIIDALTDLDTELS